MRKAFLRSPIKFARISSRFSKGRKHPILGKTRAHKGVDYAAPNGTPIRAAGNGTISFLGKKGGYGKTVIIDHGNGKSTLYAHMSRYGRNKKKGRRVEQGDVIGYVGSTGMATGPHLHYEFRIDGVHRNPLTVKLPIAKPIEKKYRDDFRRKTAPLMAQLDNLSRTLVADAR
jgi:murein DD-endopeptidase MepM/ murein hydrolase activator NlpD